MSTRRDFLRNAALLTGAAGLSGFMPESIQRAFAIDPEFGSTYMDAEHVVILMQENRSFDHCFGTLRGVRGYKDPRAITLPNKNLVWMQTNAIGETYAPFRLDIKDSKITWMGALPHGRSNQVDANNLGKFDQWLEAKRSSNKLYADMPLTMGHYTREDIPFNYALADAFTVCDQNFSSTMTSTFPNRSFLWTGTIREKQDGESKAHIRNGDFQYGESKWKTFPERLEENGIDWRVYQNDIYCGGGYEGEEKSMLGNFGCNPLEYFANFNVKFNPAYVASLQSQVATLPKEILDLKTKAADGSLKEALRNKALKDITAKEMVFENATRELKQWTKANYEQLSLKDKSLNNRAFTKNSGDKNYRQLTTLNYLDGTTKREAVVPKGDLLHQLREDVKRDKLPTVSWIVPPGRFSDHPSAPWYGAWYVSEVIDILTQNPEIWKKTIFILTYDENDGYFDHIPPFVAPDPKNPETGKCSKGIDTSVEFVRLDQELKETYSNDAARGGPIGLGYRVPMIIASPWSRGGQVCSQVFDHTSSLRFLEKFLSKKTGREIKETNISDWRRTVSGDLSAAFTPYKGEKLEKLPFLQRDPFIETLHKARFKQLPNGFKKLSTEEIAQLNHDPSSSPFMPQQEPGIRPSCALPYQLYAEGKLSADKKQFEMIMEARKDVFGARAAGSPFNIYLPGEHVRSYAVTAGDRLMDSWPIDSFENGRYHLRTYGPNGFFREFTGKTDDPLLEITCEYERSPVSGKKLTGNIALKIVNLNFGPAYTLEIKDHAYKKDLIRKTLPKRGSGKNEITVILDQSKSFGWYDFSIRIAGFDDFEKRYAGRVETGRNSFSDPAMG